MAFVLEVRQQVLILKLQGTGSPKMSTVTETIAPFINASPYLIIDLGNERITSIAIGTLVNIASSYQKVWGDDFAPINIINIDTLARQMIDISSLNMTFRVWGDLQECYKHLTTPS